MIDDHRLAAIAYVDLIVRETGLDLTNLARRAGVSSTTLTRFRNDPRYRNSLSGRTLKKLSDVSGIPLPMALGGAGLTAPRASNGPQNSDAIPRDLPVLGRAASPREDYSFRGDGAPSFVERPWFLFGQPDAYAVYINDGAMEPAFARGQLAYVSAAAPALPGNDVVVQLTDGSGFIKRLVRQGARRFTLKQFDPVKTIEVDIERVRSIHPVVGVLRART